MAALVPEIKNQSLICKNLRVLRERRGMTLQELAASLGVTYQQVQKYEKGESGISAPRLYALSHILHAPYDDFFTGIDDPRAALSPPVAIHPAILVRALKLQKNCPPTERTKILKIIDILVP